MLEFIRNNARSWLVKLLFGIIVLVFVFWGVGSFRGNKQQTLAEVGDMKISTKEFMQYHKRRLRQLQESRPNLDQEKLRKMDFKRSVFDQLVNQKLLLKKAKDLNLFVTPAELKGMITNMEAFRNEDKAFDERRYRSILRANNMVPGQFESRMQQQLLRQKLRSALAASVNPGVAEARDLFNFIQEKARIEYINYDQDEYLDQVEIGEEEIKEYYQNNKEKFEQPARMRIKYILLTAESLAAYEDVNDQEIEEYYQANKEMFQREKQVKARHILVKVEDTASEEKVENAREKIEYLKQKLERDADFDSLAKKESEGPTAKDGGNLGWINKGEMTESFEKAAFDLQPGEVSDPVRTEYGFHLIKVEDKRDKGSKPLNEVRDKVRKEVAISKAAGKIEDKLDMALDILLSTGNFNKVAEKIGVEIKKSGLFSENKGPGQLDLDSENIQKLFSLKKGEITNYPIMLENGYLLAQNIEEKEAYIPDLERVRPAIEKELSKQKAKDLARKKAKKDLKQIIKADGNSLGKLASKIRESELFNRRGPIPGLGSNSELIQKAFQAENKEWFSKPFKVPSGYVLARLKERVSPSKEDWQAQQSVMTTSLQRSQRRQLLNAYVQQLRDGVEINVISPEVLKY